MKDKIRPYVRLMRIDHWIKNIFIIPGMAFALILTEPSGIFEIIWKNCLPVFIATCLTASSNYVLNEWLDAPFDRFHPIKKHRSSVEYSLDSRIIYTMYVILALFGFLLSGFVSTAELLLELCLWIMGIIYNVKPFRSKDLPFVDVLSESVNNAIRLLIGWFAFTNHYLPPVSIVLGYWFGGAFLMDVKRFSEYRMISDKHLLKRYRKSFAFYTEEILLCAAFFYAMASSFFTGIFLIKYRVEFIIIIPFLIGLFCYYLYIGFHDNSPAQAPEKLFHERGLIAYALVLALMFFTLLYTEIPVLQGLLSDTLLELP